MPLAKYPLLGRTLGQMSTFSQSAPTARPFGAGLQDEDLKLMVASTDMRYRQKLKAVIVRRTSLGRAAFLPFAAELIVLNTPENIASLKMEAHKLDTANRLRSLEAGDIKDIVLTSSATHERVMITSVGLEDFQSLEQLASVVQIHITDSDRGSWVCRLIDSDRIDALFGGRIIDVRAN